MHKHLWEHPVLSRLTFELKAFKKKCVLLAMGAPQLTLFYSSSVNSPTKFYYNSLP